jgi:hypothetical protein
MITVTFEVVSLRTNTLSESVFPLLKTQPQTRRNTSLLIYCSLATRCDIYAGIPGT